MRRRVDVMGVATTSPRGDVAPRAAEYAVHMVDKDGAEILPRPLLDALFDWCDGADGLTSLQLQVNLVRAFRAYTAARGIKRRTKPAG